MFPCASFPSLGFPTATLAKMPESSFFEIVYCERNGKKRRVFQDGFLAVSERSAAVLASPHRDYVDGEKSLQPGIPTKAFQSLVAHGGDFLPGTELVIGRRDVQIIATVRLQMLEGVWCGEAAPCGLPQQIVADAAAAAGHSRLAKSQSPASKPRGSSLHPLLSLSGQHPGHQPLPPTCCNNLFYGVGAKRAVRENDVAFDEDSVHCPPTRRDVDPRDQPTAHPQQSTCQTFVAGFRSIRHDLSDKTSVQCSSRARDCSAETVPAATRHDVLQDLKHVVDPTAIGLSYIESATSNPQFFRRSAGDLLGLLSSKLHVPSQPTTTNDPPGSCSDYCNVAAICAQTH